MNPAFSVKRGTQWGTTRPNFLVVNVCGAKLRSARFKRRRGKMKVCIRGRRVSVCSAAFLISCARPKEFDQTRRSIQTGRFVQKSTTTRGGVSRSFGNVRRQNMTAGSSSTSFVAQTRRPCYTPTSQRREDAAPPFPNTERPTRLVPRVARRASETASKRLLIERRRSKQRAILFLTPRGSAEHNY